MNSRDPSLLIEQIAAVFPVEPIPTAAEVIKEGLYEDLEREEIREFFAGRPWTAVTPKDVFRFRLGLFDFSKRAFAYYTAAWMTCILLDLDAVDTADMELVSGLRTADPNFWTKEQRRVICDWLAWMEERDDLLPFEREHVMAAAKNLGCAWSHDPS